MKNRKSGATLIFVIVIFMFVCSVSVAMLSMVIGNYRARVSESKRIENLYSSESGIDMAYNISGKTIEAATRYGYYQVSKLRRRENTGNNFQYSEALNKDISDLKTRIEDIEREIETIINDDDRVRRLFEEIDRCKKGIETDKLTLNELYKEEFKRAFKLYIQKEDSDDVVNNTNVLKDSIEGKKYIDVSLKYKNEEAPVDADTETKEVNASFTEYKVEFPYSPVGKDENNHEQEWPLLSVNKLTFNECPDDKKVEITNNHGDGTEEHITNVNFYRVTGEYYNLTIESKFLSAEQNTNVVGDENIRKVQATYKILVPNYEDVIWSSSKEEPKTYNILIGNNDRGLTIGGNMNVDKVNTLNVKGDIFVQGNGNGEDYGKVYNKYKGGITIADSDKVNFKPVDNKSENNEVNVNTRGTFNIQNDSNVTIGSSDFASCNGNLYAANIYAGYIAKDSDDFTDNSKLNVNNNVVIDNDLTVKAKNTHFTIRNFYGINDKNIKYDDENGKIKDSSNDNIEKTSSSIIINGHKDINGGGKSTVNIVNSAYIMGTAHIATAGNYKTGESIAVKGNYTAYAVPVSPDEVFKYDSPLQVLDEENIFKKAEHFTNYWNGIGKGGINITKGNADDGGIILPDDINNIHSIGAIVYKTTGSSEQDQTIVRSSNYIIEDEQNGGAVYTKRAEYAKRVYDLGITPYDEEHDYMKNYSDGESKADKVSSLLYKLTEEGLPEDYKWRVQLEKAKDGEEVAIFNPTEEDIIIDKDMSAVIVTNGNVIINANVNFKGNIIAKGNLTIKKENSTIEKVTIEYNEEIVENIQEKYGEVFAAVFGHFEVPKEDTKSKDDTSLKQVLDGQYDIKRYLENKLWKLIQ